MMDVLQRLPAGRWGPAEAAAAAGPGPLAACRQWQAEPGPSQSGPDHRTRIITAAVTVHVTPGHNQSHPSIRRTPRCHNAMIPGRRRSAWRHWRQAAGHVTVTSHHDSSSSPVPPGRVRLEWQPGRCRIQLGNATRPDRRGRRRAGMIKVGRAGRGGCHCPAQCAWQPGTVHSLARSQSQAQPGSGSLRPADDAMTQWCQ